jgi:hypothetical protein
VTLSIATWILNQNNACFLNSLLPTRKLHFIIQKSLARYLLSVIDLMNNGLEFKVVFVSLLQGMWPGAQPNRNFLISCSPEDRNQHDSLTVWFTYPHLHTHTETKKRWSLKLQENPASSTHRRPKISYKKKHKSYRELHSQAAMSRKNTKNDTSA